MTNDEAMRLAHLTLRAMEHEQSAVNLSWADVRALCDHILSGDHKREIENAAYERVARWCEREDIERDPDDLYSGRAHRAAAIRALIQPPAQKENGE